MSFIILNGKKSSLIKGLLIQSLPPIIKPLIRTKTETIDGRDGDITRKLGYSAYDKQMSIGLFGDYDINEVIHYFDSEGIVVFSNEPDKFYKYKILQQINFEALLRFKTATVTFHCQPFKFSAVDDAFTFSIDKLKPIKYSSSKFGVTVSSENGVISVKGTPTFDTEFYFPIKPMTLGSTSYTLKALTSGTGESKCKIRVIEDTPTDADSFGGQALVLEESGTATLTATPSEPKTFKYIWMYIQSGTAIDFTLLPQMIDNTVDSFEIFNKGNIYSRPRLTLYGSGTVKLSINDVELFTMTIDGYITLDGEDMNAYKGDALANRSVSGNYNNLRFEVGTNKLSWVGTVTEIKVENDSRWI